MNTRMETGSVLQLGVLGLRLRSQPVVDPTAPDIQALVDRLIATASARSGVGIAAPQMGARQRLFIVASRPNPRYPDAPMMDPTAMINPTVTARSEEMVWGWEGCLSVPGWRGRVPRSQAVEVIYWDTQGCQHHRVFTGFVARIIQHEYDHLEGGLFLDRVVHTRDLLSEADYRREHYPTAS